MTVTVTAVIEPGAQPGVRVSVAASPATLVPLQLTRVHEDGTVSKVLTTEFEPMVVSGTYSGVDYCPPFNQAFYYRAVVGAAGSGTGLGPVIYSRKTWLIDAQDPTKSFAVDAIRKPADPVYPNEYALYQVLDRKLPISDVDTARSGEQGELTVVCRSLVARRRLRRLLSAGWVFLINTPYDETDIGHMWVQPGALTQRNLALHQTYPDRDMIFPYVQVEAPDISVNPQWTVAQIRALGLTVAQLRARYTTVPDLKYNHRTDV